MFHHILLRSQPALLLALHQRSAKTDRDAVSQAATFKPWVHIAPISSSSPAAYPSTPAAHKPLTRSPRLHYKASPSRHGALPF